jgi:nicotinamide mononucleotide (NMN) deamidase PncC
MPLQPTDSDLQDWHKRFASSANNRAWELSVLERTAEQNQEMLDVAHASAWHWSAIGTELNRMRANMLLAEVHALVGFGTTALRYAEEMRSYFVGRETADWELAFTHVIHAHAASAAGAVDTHRVAYGKALAAIKTIADEEDRTIVNKTFSHVPLPS